MREGDWGRVLREAEQATPLAPFDAALITGLAETLVPAGAYDQALKNVEYGAARNPASADYHQELRAWIYRLQGRLAESARESQGAHMLNPHNRLQYAITLVRRGRMDEARAEVTKVRTEEPVFTLTTWRAGTFYADPAILPGELADLAKAGLPE